MSPTEAIRIYLAYLSDKKKIVERRSFAFTTHWLSYSDFDQLNELLTSLCDQVDATYAGSVCADSRISETPLRGDGYGAVPESDTHDA